MSRFVCIHGHFYQPPRENPWTDAVPRQPSAAPFHDWNARITRECYVPNAAARVLRRDGQIARLVNNYGWISFDFGPTLLSWLERHAPTVYSAILAADRTSAARFGGHGSAIAQAYHHGILPLYNDADRRTEIHWGRRDFEHRFGRAPEGIWLPETAVDIPTLEAIAADGFRFTILAPHQARRVRPRDGGAWQEATADSLVTTMPYMARLPSGRSVALFFYDGPTSRAVAFEKLLDDGATFVERLLGCFAASDQETEGPRLVQIATDGETYGHHHPFGEMALAFATGAFAAEGGPRLTNYGEYLALHPPTHEVEIAERTSWSCAHGIDRWRSDCGCRIDPDHGGSQAWRATLRESFDWLRDTVAAPFAERAGELLRDPAAARDAYIDVVVDRHRDRHRASVERFFAAHARGVLDAEQRRSALRLMELQRHLLMTYTSCGWFFDDIAGVEPRQNLAHGAMAIDLCREALDLDLQQEFRSRLRAAGCNTDGVGNGATSYDQVRVASVLRPVDVAIHAAESLYLGAPSPSALGDAHRFTLGDTTRESLGGRAFYAWHFTVTTTATGADDDIGVVLLDPRVHFALPQVRAGDGVGLDRHGQMLVALHQAGADGASACFGRFGYAPVQPDPTRLAALHLVAAERLAREGDGDGGRASFAFASLCATPAGINPVARQQLAAALQRRLSVLLTPPEPIGSAGIDPEALLAVVRTHDLVLDRHGLSRTALASVARVLERMDDDPPETAALIELLRLVDLVHAFTIDCDLRQLEQRCISLLRRPPADSSRDWHETLRRLATRLHIDAGATLT